MANIINIGGGANGGGSNVVPNPQGAATDTLVKLGIEGTIYDFAGGGSSGHNYSTTEQVVGTWIDGSTIYEKTIVATNIRVNTSDWQNLEQISDIDKLISTEGTITILFNGQQTGIGQYFNVSVNSSGYVRFFCTAWNNETADVVVTVRYTKTST